MKVSIITIVYNGKATIKDTICSILSQTYNNIEYIIIDGGSNDGTLEIVKNYGDRINALISEPDQGIYDAMNKGIALATGDVVGILNSDDYYIDEFAIEKIVKAFEEKEVNSVFADLVYIGRNDSDKIVRKYDSSQFSSDKFAYGWAPAHPTFFVKRNVYRKYGMFRTDLKIAADFDLLVRFLYTYKISYYYLQETIIKMRIGGVSTSLSSIWINNIETLKVCKENGIETNIFKILSKYPNKIASLFRRQ